MTQRNQVIGLDKFAAKMQRLDRALQTQALTQALTAAALSIEAQAKANVESNFSTDASTGTLLRSIGIEVMEVSADRVTVAIGTNLVYAAIHEFGGEIRARNGRFLSIPLTNEAKAVPGGSPRNFPRELTPIVRGDRGTLRDDAGIAQYALVTHVTIPARPYLRPAFDEKKDEAVEDFVAALQTFINQAVTRAA